MSQQASLRILVCGDADRGDNGAPLIAIGRLLPTLPRAVLDQVEVRRREQLDVADLADLAARRVNPVPRSAHLAPIGDGIRNVGMAHGGGPAGSFVGIGGRSYGFGVPLSIPVRTALPSFVAAIGTEINRLLAAGVTDAP